MRQPGQTPARLFPLSAIRAFGLEGPKFTGISDHGAEFCQGTDFAGSARLDEDIPEYCGLDRSRQHGPLAGVGGELVEQ